MSQLLPSAHVLVPDALAERPGTDATSANIVVAEVSVGDVAVADVVLDLSGGAEGDSSRAIALLRDHHPLVQTEKPPSVTVVIPTLNEADNLPHVLPVIPAWVDEVIIVDGGSHDGTIDVVRRLVPDALIVMQSGKGKGNALAEGFAAASGDIIVMLDADGSTDPAEIPRYVAALRTGADFAKGTRFMIGGGSVDITSVRRMGNKALAGLVNVLWNTRFSDLCYGYNAFWRKCLSDIAIDCPGFEVETLLNIRAAAAGLRIAEVPSFEYSRLNGISNLNAGRDGMRILRTIVAERIRPR